MPIKEIILDNISSGEVNLRFIDYPHKLSGVG
jgi:hypothetical protein